MNALFQKTITALTLFAAVLLAAGNTAAETTITYLVNDGLGSPIAAMDEQGAVVWRKDYQPYGSEYTRHPAATDESIGFTGHVQDRSSGLTYMGARYYDPMTGRFMAADPVGFDESNPMSFSRYGYANSNPYKYVDPDGRAATPNFFRDPTKQVLFEGGGVGGGGYTGGRFSFRELFGGQRSLAESKGVGSKAKDVSGSGAIAKNKSLSTIRQAGSNETFVRFESQDVRFSRVTEQGGLKPQTYAAPSSELPVPISQRASRFNLPDPQIPRTRELHISAPGDMVIGPRPVSGGSGNEVLFPFGTRPGTVK